MYIVTFIKNYHKYLKRLKLVSYWFKTLRTYLFIFAERTMSDSETTVAKKSFKSPFAGLWSDKLHCDGNDSGNITESVYCNKRQSPGIILGQWITVRFDSISFVLTGQGHCVHLTLVSFCESKTTFVWDIYTFSKSSVYQVYTQKNKANLISFTFVFTISDIWVGNRRHLFFRLRVIFLLKYVTWHSFLILMASFTILCNSFFQNIAVSMDQPSFLPFVDLVESSVAVSHTQPSFLSIWLNVEFKSIQRNMEVFSVALELQ